MATIGVNKLKGGVVFIDDDGDIYRVMKYEFIKLARGKANIKVKAKNLFTGAIVNKSYLSGNRVEEAELNKQEMQYLYKDEKTAYFMDPGNFEQLEVERGILGEDLRYLVEGKNAWVVSFGERVIGVEIPAAVVMAVVETEPWIKGNSATNVYKPAKLESGLMVQVPLFIKPGDKIKVNTDSGSYVARING